MKIDMKLKRHLIYFFGKNANCLNIQLFGPEVLINELEGIAISMNKAFEKMAKCRHFGLNKFLENYICIFCLNQKEGKIIPTLNLVACNKSSLDIARIKMIINILWNSYLSRTARQMILSRINVSHICDVRKMISELFEELNQSKNMIGSKVRTVHFSKGLRFFLNLRDHALGY